MKVGKLRPGQGADLLSATQGRTECWLVIWAVPTKVLGPSLLLTSQTTLSK